MQRRLLLILLVFAVGFGVGYGITWLMVGSADRGADRAATREAVRSATPAVDAAASTEPAAAPDAGPEVAAEVVPPLPDAGPSETSMAAVAADASAIEAVAETAAPSKAEWEACHLHACRVDFGRISGGISVRKGSLEHGAAIDWDRDFAKADKIGTLEAGANVKVEVLAIGLDDGEPAAAYIIKKTRKDELKGVIALRIGEKALRLVPIE